jgi:hypothetical protein
MKKISPAALLLLSLFALTACNKETTYEKSIINHSSRALKVVVETTFGGKSDTLAIAAGETKTIDSFVRSGNDKDGFLCTEDLIGLAIVLPAGDSLVLDVLNDDNWTHSKTKLDGYLHDCQLLIEDEDIQ